MNSDQTALVTQPARVHVSGPVSTIPRPSAIRGVLARVLVLNLLVVAIKIVIGVRTGALSVLGAALESSLDTLNNIVGMVLVSVAARAPDENHPYGHDKFETLGALTIVGFLSISCFELLREGITQFTQRHVPKAPSTAELALLGFTLVVNIVIVIYERRRGRELGSQFLLADAAHTGSDTYVTLLAISSLLLTRVGLGVLDPLLAIVVALIIAWSGFRILRGTVPILVDERAVDPKEIERILAAIPSIRDVRLVRSRSSASGVLFAEVTISVAASMTVQEGHELADAVEARISDALGNSEVTVHVEPA
jgi:cation diffusion facilitator family transporter